MYVAMMYSVCGVQCGYEDSLLIIMCIIQDITDVNYEATLEPTTQPCLMLCLNKEDCFLVIEKKVMFKVNVKHAVLVLFASFFVFNLNLLCLWLY